MFEEILHRNVPLFLSNTFTVAQVVGRGEKRIMGKAVKPCMRPFSRAKRSYIVISVGGSLIVPDAIDTDFLRAFRTTLLNLVEQGFSFYIITGGGKLARNYQHAAETIRGDLHSEDLDWLGIHSTRLNAHLMRALFKEQAQARIIKNPMRGGTPRSSIVIGAGWKPGWSTDYCAVMAAKRLGAKKLINLSNIDYVYDKNPNEFPDAKKIETIDWKKFRTLIPDHWDPGLSSPFDPIAAKEAEHAKLEVAVINGNKLEEFKNYLLGEKFVGSVIS